MTVEPAVELRDTTAAELPAIRVMERGAAREWVDSYSLQRHRAEMAKPGVVYKSIRRGDELLGFVILALGADGECVELRRIVVAAPGRGIGSRALALARDLCRQELGRSRIWLDVLDTNARARHVYEAGGYRPFGTTLHEGETLVLYEVTDGT